MLMTITLGNDGRLWLPIVPFPPPPPTCRTRQITRVFSCCRKETPPFLRSGGPPPVSIGRSLLSVACATDLNPKESRSSALPSEPAE